MKLASYHDGSRDGQLLVVSRDLSTAHFATGMATRLQQVLDDWNFLSPQLQDLYVTLNQGKARHAFNFEPRLCMAPLPRAGQWAVGSACPSYLDRLQRAGGAPQPGDAAAVLRMSQGASDDFLGPCSDAWFGTEAWGIDFEAGLAVITGEVGMGASPEQALDGVRLLMLANGWALRQWEASERAGGLGLVQSRPAAAFGPVAVTPDELGPAWQSGRVHLTLQSICNGRRVGQTEAGTGMAWHFGQLIAHLAKTRNLRAGAVVGSGPVSHANPGQGCSSLAELRAIEVLDTGQARTGYLRLGDTLRIEMMGRDGQSVFGAIDQRVTGPAVAGADTAGTAALDAVADTRPAGPGHADPV